MNSEPRLNKLPFILTDAGCLIAALLIGLFAKDPFAPLPLILITTLIVAGGVALLIPYLADYAADSRESSARLRDELEMQIKRVQAASESLSRAAAQIKAVEEAVQKSVRETETLPYRMQEKLAEFNEALSEKENEDREALERELEELRAANTANLKAVAERSAKTTAEWSTLEVATRKQLNTAQEAAGKLDELLRTTLTQLDAKVADVEKAFARAAEKAAAQLAAIPAPTPAPAVVNDRRAEAPEQVDDGGHRPPLQETTKPEVAAEPRPVTVIPEPEPAPAPAAEPAPITSEPAVVTLESPPAAEPPKPKKPRAPRKPKPEETLATMSDVAATVGAEGIAAEISAQAPVLEKEAEVTASMETTGAAPVEASASSDGATRLLATAYIGIGNKLFIRGDGPGLSWERGIPMQFVSIGKWGWSTHEATGPVKVKLYKNDESAALSGEITLEPARHTEVTALF